MYAASIEGNINLDYSSSGLPKNAFKREFGNGLKATCNWYVSDFFGKETVFAGIVVKNSTASSVSFQYYVAFYDKDNKLVGVATQGTVDNELKPGEQMILSSCLIVLPKKRYKDIVSYQAVVYEINPSGN